MVPSIAANELYKFLVSIFAASLYNEVVIVALHVRVVYFFAVHRHKVKRLRVKCHRVNRHRVKRPRVKRHRVSRQTVKNATKGKKWKKYFMYYFRIRLRQFLGRALRLGQARGPSAAATWPIILNMYTNLLNRLAQICGRSARPPSLS